MDENPIFGRLRAGGCELICRGSKDGVIEWAIDLNKFKKRNYIGIVDRDFSWHPTNGAKIVSQVYETDTHDQETMVLRSNAFGDFLKDYADDVLLDRLWCKTPSSRMQLIEPAGRC